MRLLFPPCAGHLVAQYQSMTLAAACLCGRSQRRRAIQKLDASARAARGGGIRRSMADWKMGELAIASANYFPSWRGGAGGFFRRWGGGGPPMSLTTSPLGV